MDLSYQLEEGGNAIVEKKKEEEGLVSVMLTGTASKPLPFTWFEHHKNLFSHVKSTMGILDCGGSLSCGDLKAEHPSALLLSGSSGWQASEVACGKGNGMDCSGGCGVCVCGLWPMCGEVSVTSVPMEEDSIT